MRERRRGSVISTRASLLIALAVFSVLSLLSLSFIPAGTEAGDGLKTVRGYVWDSSFNPVQGAEVNVSMITPGDTLRSYILDTTDSAGMYSVVFFGFGGQEWEIGDTIRVTASYDIYENTNSTIATATQSPDWQPIQWVNVSLIEYTIPEFGSSLVIVISGTLAVFMAVAHSARRRR